MFNQDYLLFHRIEIIFLICDMQGHLNSHEYSDEYTNFASLPLTVNMAVICKLLTSNWTQVTGAGNFTYCFMSAALPII